MSALSKLLIKTVKKRTDSVVPGASASGPDFSRLLSLFEHPVYGGQELIIRKYLSYVEAREECADVGYVWKCDEEVYMDFMPPPPLSTGFGKDWLFSSVFYVALDDEADVFPDKMQKLLSAITETKNLTVFSSYSQALRLLHCLHVELRCPVKHHDDFWKAHAFASSGNFASLISRITRLSESRYAVFLLCLFGPSLLSARMCLLDIFRFVSGYPSYSTQLRLRRLQGMVSTTNVNQRESDHSDATIVRQSTAVCPEDMYSPVKPRSDSLLGQTSQQIRRRARDTILQINSPNSCINSPPVGKSNLENEISECADSSGGTHRGEWSSVSRLAGSIDRMETVEENSEDSSVQSVEDVMQPFPEGTSEFSSFLSVKTVAKHSILPVVKRQSGRVQTFADIATDISDPCVKGKVPPNDSEAIEGALRRFTEMGAMFASSAAAMDMQASLSVRNKKESDRKSAVLLLLINEFLGSLPWKVSSDNVFAENSICPHMNYIV